MDESSALGALAEAGLDPKSARLYLTLLRTRRMTVAELARESGVKRATCYEHLDQLLSRNFVTRIPVGKRMFYSANDPKKIVAEFRKRLETLESKAEVLQNIRNEVVHRPRVVFYEGRREIRNIYNELFKTVGDAYSIFPAETFFQSFTVQDYDDFDKEISKHAFRTYDLLSQDRYYKRVREIRSKNSSSKKYDKKLPKDFKNNVDVLVFSDKVALISLRDLSALVIQNSDIAELFRSLHGFIWKHS